MSKKYPSLKHEELSFKIIILPFFLLPLSYVVFLLIKLFALQGHEEGCWSLSQMDTGDVTSQDCLQLE